MHGFDDIIIGRKIGRGQIIVFIAGQQVNPVPVERFQAIHLRPVLNLRRRGHGTGVVIRMTMLGNTQGVKAQRHGGAHHFLRR